MKRIIVFIMLLVSLFSICACTAPTQTGAGDSSINTPQNEDTLANQLVGGWAYKARTITDILVLSSDGVARYFDPVRTTKEKLENNVGTYSLKNNQLWIDLRNFYVNTDSGWNVEIDEDIMRWTLESDSNRQFEFIRLKGENEPHSIVGRWVPLNFYDLRNSGVPLIIENLQCNITEIEFYNDGSYRRQSGDFEGYGKYELLFDGEAIELTENLDSGKIDIQMLGYGLMLYEYEDQLMETQLIYVLYQDEVLQKINDHLWT